MEETVRVDLGDAQKDGWSRVFEGSEDGRDEGSGRGLKTRWVQRVGEDQEERAEGTGWGNAEGWRGGQRAFS